MDAKLRGLIEQRFEDELDSFIENEDIAWVRDTAPISSKQDFAPISSKQDFLLGFIVGKLTVIAWTYLTNATDEDLREVREIIARRLPEIRTKITEELNI